MFPKRGAIALTVTAVALVLLLNFKTPDETVPTRTDGSVAVVEEGTQGTTTKPAASAAPASRAPSARATATPGAGAAGTTVDGPVISTQFGSIQVEVVVADGRLKDVIALQLPSGRRSGQISNYSAPILRSEALQAQSANIDTVSGATYTSDAYARSLQAALDQAGVS